VIRNGVNRYVATDQIKTAVKGRETEILDNLGIRWQSRQHIHCPYPAHEDRHPSWRWDRRKALAFCTCSKLASIFDVVMKVKDIDFDAAKLCIAEVLGRHDLIRDRTDGQHRQRQDAASLLNPPNDNRDDELPFTYLAARLGVDPAELPRLTTPIAGAKALEYFDPPVREGAKPKLVGSWPCAVFGTIAADGRRHAHRIYLAPDGRSKASLGEVRRGEGRNPKKSAKLADGQPTSAGCATFWGNPERAPHIVVAEGIETAAAIAYSLQDQIRNGDVAVAAAISAVGIEAFLPWPMTKSVTIAADRDEAKESAGYKRGEKAARAFAGEHFRERTVHVALPGQPGESVDWLDILRRDGMEAVRRGMSHAARFEPTGEEVEPSENTAAREGDVERVANAYPLPVMDLVELEYQRRKSGEIWAHRPDRLGNWHPIFSPFGVVGLLRRADNGTLGLRVVVEDMNGQPRTVDFDRYELGKIAASEIRGRLFDTGLRVEGDGESVCVQILKAAKPTTCIITVSRPGWHRLPELTEPVFITPIGDAIGLPNDVAVELDATIRLPVSVGRSGNLEGWQHAVRCAVLAESCAHWVLAIAAGFAGVIVDLTGLDTCGVDYSGKTSVGKTTGQRLAVSAWSSPKLSDNGLLRSWRSTENAIEVHARNASGTVLALDEMAHQSGVIIGRVLYSLAGDVGKSRMRPDSSLRDSYTWSTFVLLSSEKPLEQKVRDDGGQWTGGMAVRFPDIDVGGVNRYVPRETITSIEQIFNHYGHAGPQFVRKLVENGLHQDPDKLRERITSLAHNLAGSDADSAKVRAALPFAVISIAGALAREFGILPAEADIAGAVKWAWEEFCNSSDAQVLDPEEHAVGKIQQFINEGWDVTIKCTKPDANTNNREAVGWYDDDTVYLPTERLAEAAGRVANEQQIARMLDRRGYLSRRTDKKRIAIRYVPRIGRVACYALKRSEFGRNAAIADLQAVGTYGG
jgi:phage/plasmid primase-like uncharacterized protein